MCAKWRTPEKVAIAMKSFKFSSTSWHFAAIVRRLKYQLMDEALWKLSQNCMNNKLLLLVVSGALSSH